ncbi:MAG: hypothetical protein ABIF71_14595 [Planctomycetota bacterium]
MKQSLIVILCWGVVVLGMAPEVQALAVASSASTCTANDPAPDAVAAAAGTLDACEVNRILGDKEIAAYAGNPAVIQGGGAYSSGSNQYSGMFGNMENFVVELVEFFLFLALVSYAIGYEEWLPWEKNKN